MQPFVSILYFRDAVGLIAKSTCWPAARSAATAWNAVERRQRRFLNLGTIGGPILVGAIERRSRRRETVDIVLLRLVDETLARTRIP